MIAKIQRRQKRMEKQYAPLLYNALNKQVLSFIADIKKYGVVYAKRQPLDSKALESALKQLYKTVALDAANYMYADLRAKVKARAGMGVNQAWLEEVQRYLNEYLVKAIGPITEYSKRQILQIIEEAMVNGLSVEEMVQKLEYMKILNQRRAMKIVRTEVTTATNLGHMLGANESEYLYTKKWIEVKDSRTRATHRHGTNVDRRGRIVQGVGGEVVDFLQPFSNGLQYPGDNNGKASERVNCRCVVTFALKRDENGRAIKKPQPTRYTLGPTGRRTNLVEALLSGFTASMIAQQINDYINNE